MASKFVVGAIIRVLLNDTARLDFVRDLAATMGEARARKTIRALQTDLDRLYPQQTDPDLPPAA